MYSYVTAYRNHNLDCFHHPRLSLVRLCSLSLPSFSNPLVTADLLSGAIVFSSLEFNITGIIECVDFCVWLFDSL